MRNHIRYLLFAGILLASLLLSAATVNYLVDPYNLLGRNKMGVYFSNERLAKSAILTYPHQAVLIGSSKTSYINPDDLSCYKFYNASIRGTVPEELHHFLKKYLRDEKLLLIGFDFYMFNERETGMLRIRDEDDFRYSKIEYLLGASVLRSSYKTFRRWRKGVQTTNEIAANGQITYTGASKLAEPPFGGADENGQRYRDTIAWLESHHYGNYYFSRQRMDFVRSIKELLEEKAIPYAAFINPLNQDVLAALQGLECWDLFTRWKREMKAIFPDLYDYSVGPYSGREWFYRDDPFHYTPAAGKSFLNEIIRNFCPNTSGSPS